MGRVFLRYVDAETVHCCAACRAHLAAHEAIISKAFQGRHGRAYLFDDVVNVNSGPTENRLLLTGLHVVADIYCNACDTRLGWKYVEAFEESQKYKEGKFILEKAMIMKEDEIRQRRAEQLARLEAQRERAARGEAISGEGALLDEGEEGEEGDEDEEDEEEDEGEEEDEEVEEGEDDENAVRHSGDGGLPRSLRQLTGGGGGPRTLSSPSQQQHWFAGGGEEPMATERDDER